MCHQDENTTIQIFSTNKNSYKKNVWVNIGWLKVLRHQSAKRIAKRIVVLRLLKHTGKSSFGRLGFGLFGPLRFRLNPNGMTAQKERADSLVSHLPGRWSAPKSHPTVKPSLTTIQKTKESP